MGLMQWRLMTHNSYMIWYADMHVPYRYIKIHPLWVFLAQTCRTAAIMPAVQTCSPSRSSANGASPEWVCACICLDCSWTLSQGHQSNILQDIKEPAPWKNQSMQHTSVHSRFGITSRVSSMLHQTSPGNGSRRKLWKLLYMYRAAHFNRPTFEYKTCLSFDRSKMV